MFTLLFLLAVFGLNQCNGALPTSFEIESSINRTISEVERMISANPNLPRLSRREIVDILYNITSKDLDVYTDKREMEQARSMYQRALMVVLPFNAKETEEDLKDLYTRQPMTQLITDPPPPTSVRTDTIEYKEPTFDTKTTRDPITTSNFVTDETPLRQTSVNSKNRYKNHKDTYSDVQTKPPSKYNFRPEPAPMKFSFNLENLQRNYNKEKSTSTSTTRRPVYRKRPANESSNKVEIVYSTDGTTTSTTPTTTTAREITIELGRPKSSTSTPKPSQNILTQDQWRYNAPPSTSQKTPVFIHKYRVTTNSPKPHFMPTTIKISADDGVAPTKNPEAKIKTTSADVVKRVESEALFVTPMSTTTSEKTKYSSTYSDNIYSTPMTTTPMREEIQELLASIGLHPDRNLKIPEESKHNEIFDTKFQIPDSISVGNTPIVGLSTVNEDSASIANQNTFENPESDIRKGVSNLTPDVQLMFQRFGLQTSLDKLTTTTTTPKPTQAINFNSYTNFKPLPFSSVRDDEMREFLAKFGLGVQDGRNKKAMKSPTTPSSLLEAVPENMKKILENIGLISKQREPFKPLTTTEKIDVDLSKLHVFKPHESVVRDESQRQKINKLLDTVKMVQDGKANANDIQRIANDLLETTKALKEGPDPVSLEEIIRIYNEDVKNEVKRQQNQDEYTSMTSAVTTEASSSESLLSVATNETDSDTASATISMTSDSAKEASDQDSVSTTTVKSSSLSVFDTIDLTAFLDTSTSSPKTETLSESPNLDALADSFGGSTQAPDPVLPTKRRNGLYFLVDWNTFLEVGEEGKDKVNLRFQPKVGDRTRFIPVKVP